jgi:large subunit ribosomal protein L3
MKPKLMGIKQGMMQIFDENGNKVACTVISMDKHVVTQVKSKATDGYDAIQLAAMKVTAPKVRNVKKPLMGHFKKAGVDPRKNLCETRVAEGHTYQLGQEIGVEVLADIRFVDVIGVSKGKGFQGVMKRHNYAGGPASHGSGFHRHKGSDGCRSTPGRVWKGQKKAGHMGAEQVTVECLRVVRVDAEKQVILVEGAVPGARNGLVYVSESKKKAAQNKKK